MLKLIDDKVQFSDAPDNLKSPALAEYYIFTDLTITFDTAITLDCIGIGYSDGTNFTLTVNGSNTESLVYSESGLYQLNKEYAGVSTLRIQHDGSFVGRLGAGKARHFTIGKAREPGFYSTSQSRVTASGQVISGAGGISGRLISVDVRSAIDEDIYNDFKNAYGSQISKGYPFFLYFNKESYRIPYSRLYGSTDNNLVFESSLNKFRYSIRLEYTERF